MLNHLFVLCAGAFAAGIGFLIPPLWPLSLIGFIPLIRTLRESTVRESIFYGGIFGLVFYGLAFWSVFWHTIPLDWVGAELPRVAQYFFVGAAWLYATLTCTVSFLIFTVLVRKLSNGTVRDLLLIPSAWVITEYFGMVLLSISLLGPSSLIGPHIAFAVLGQLLADDLVLIQVAALGGMSALSFLVIALNVFGALLITSSGTSRRALSIVALLAFISWAAAFVLIPMHEPGSDTFRVALVTTGGSAYPKNQDEEIEYGNDARKLLQEAKEADLIVLPEAAAFLGERWSPTRDELQKLVAPFSPVILDSRALKVNERWQRVVEYHASAHGTSEYAFKYFLAPYGEYLPYAFRALAQLSGYGESVREIDATRKYVRGNEAHPVSIQGILVGTLLCQEAVSSSVAREQVRRGAEILLNPQSLVWYHGSESMYARMLRHAKVRAVENRRPVIQVGDNAPSVVINEYGGISAESPAGRSVLFADVAPSHTVTPAHALGDWWLLLPFILILWNLFPKRTLT